MSSQVWQGRVNEDGSFSLLARVTSLDGTGEEYRPGEGNVLLQADVATVTCRVYDLGTDRTNQGGVEITPAPTLLPANNLYDTLRVTGWRKDPVGYNFRHDLGPAYCPDANEWVLVEYKFTLTGGGVVWAKFLVQATPVRT